VICWHFVLFVQSYENSFRRTNSIVEITACLGTNVCNERRHVHWDSSMSPRLKGGCRKNWRL